MTTLLVVDDEPTVRALLRDLLEIENYDVVEAADGDSALAFVTQQLPDLVILDVMMPGLDGIEVLQELRKKHSASDLPVILLTAKSDDDTTWQGWTAGVTVFLPKPFDTEHLLDWVSRLVRNPSQDNDEGQISELRAIDND